MKKVISLLGMILLCCGISYATKVSITDNWKFTPSDSENFASSGLDDSKWRTVSIPHTWNDKDIIDEQRGYRRAASWYRKHLNIPLEMKGRKIVLLFEGVGSKADVYLNGEHLKTHMGAYTAFTVDITGHCKFGEKNILAVRADNSSSLGEVLPPVSGDFSMLGGIYRRVFLQTYHPVHFDFEPYASTPVLVQTPVVSEESAQVKLSCRIKNDADKNSKLSLVFALLDKEGKVVSRKKMKVKVDVGQSLPVDLEMASVNNPHLWSPDSPYLYTLKATIVDDKEGTLLQEVDSPLGFRWFSVDKTGFYLNGEYLKLRGAARHQDYWGLGAAIPSEINYQDMKLLKEMGANFIRISHYPQDPEIYRACDELGLVAWSEICIVNEVKKNETFALNSAEMLKEMINQNYNHPSVVMWGAMNELWDYHDEAIRLAKELERIKKELDPYRLSCVAFHAFTWEKPYKQNSKEMFNISDINAVNVYESWYHGNFSTIAPMFDKFRNYSENKPRFLSEFGAGSDERVHTYSPRTFDFSPEFQLAFNREYINQMESRPDYVGYSIWNLIDFQVDGRGDSKPNLNQKGMLTSDRKKKEIYYYYQARWSKEPMIHIFGADWTERVMVCDGEVSRLPVTVFSNQKEVELFHNGKSLGSHPVVNGEAEFDVFFVDGDNRLKARCGELEDILNISMVLLPSKLADNKRLSEGLYINMGQDHCYFTDPLIRKTWLPDQPYRPGSWGYVDGKPFNSWPGSSHDGVRNGIGTDIKGTGLEPLYQTFHMGATAYRLDVPDGHYEVTFCFAEPFNDRERKDGKHTGVSENGERIFDVEVNGEMVAQRLNMAEEYGVQTAFTKTILITVSGGEGLDIRFHSYEGQSVVNGLKVLKLR